MSAQIGVSEPPRLAEPSPIARENSAAGDELYSQVLVGRRVDLPISAVGQNLNEAILDGLRSTLEGKCCNEGYVRPGSVIVEGVSAGRADGATAQYQVAIRMDVCAPVEGVRVRCKAQDVTKAGIRCVGLSDPTPIVVFIARDHHSESPAFQAVQVGDVVEVIVIGQRFELGDRYVAIIAKLVE